MKYKKNVISNAITHVISIAFGFISSILIARGLGAYNQGQFSFYLLVFGLIATYGHFGITTSISFFIKKTKHSKTDVINTNLSFLILLSLFYFAFIFFFQKSIFGNNNYLILTIWTFYYISLLIGTCLVNIYVAEEDIFISNKYANISILFKVIAVLILFLTHNITVVSVSIIYALIELVKMLLMFINLKIKYSFCVKYNILKEELKFGIPLYLSGLFLYLNYRADQVMIKYYIGESALGIYSLSVTLAELAKMVPDSVASAFTGKLYNCKEEEKKRIVIMTIKFSFYATVLISIIGMCCKPLIGILYGKEFIGAGLSMIILLIGIPFLAVGKVASVYYYTNGKTKMHMNISLSVLIINLLLNFYIIPKYGIYGAATTSTVSYIVYAVLYVFFLRKSEINPKNIFILDKGDFGLLREYTNKYLKMKKNSNKY